MRLISSCRISSSASRCACLIASAESLMRCVRSAVSRAICAASLVAPPPVRVPLVPVSQPLSSLSASAISCLIFRPFAEVRSASVRALYSSSFCFLYFSQSFALYSDLDFSFFSSGLEAVLAALPPPRCRSASAMVSLSVFFAFSRSIIAHDILPYSPPLFLKSFIQALSFSKS